MDVGAVRRTPLSGWSRNMLGTLLRQVSTLGQGIESKRQHAELLARYQQIRQIGLELNNRLVGTLSKSDLQEGGKRLGILRRGVLVFDTEDVTSVLMDYCLHDVRRQGRNAIERFLAESPPPADSEAMIYLQAKRTSWYSVIVVESVERGVGVNVRDLLRDESLLIVDLGFSQTAKPGVVLASRLMTADGIPMTTGAALPVGVPSTAQRNELVEAIKRSFPGVDFRQMTPDQTSKLAAMLIRHCLEQGSAEQIEYLDAGSRVSGHRTTNKQRPMNSIGRNDPCPCGSGKKYKKCCGTDGRRGPT